MGLFVVAMIILFFSLLFKENLRLKDRVDTDEPVNVESEGPEDANQPVNEKESYSKVENQENQI